VDLEVDRDACEPATGTRCPIPTELRVLNKADESVGRVIVLRDDGYLALLEFYWYEEPIRSWPSLDRLQLELGDPR
jgi:hypothetical protein